MTIYVLLKDKKPIYRSYAREGALKFADKIGALMHFGNIKKGILAAGFELEEQPEKGEEDAGGA